MKVFGDKTADGHFIAYQSGLEFYYEPTDKTKLPKVGHYSGPHISQGKALEAAQHFENEYFKNIKKQ